MSFIEMDIISIISINNDRNMNNGIFNNYY